MAATVLAFLMEGVEEIEFVTPVDIWRRAGFDVTIAALRCALFRARHCLFLGPSLVQPFRSLTPVDSKNEKGEIAAKGRSNITIMGDVLLDEVSSRDFDCVFCPGCCLLPQTSDSPGAARSRDLDPRHTPDVQGCCRWSGY